MFMNMSQSQDNLRKAATKRDLPASAHVRPNPKEAEGVCDGGFDGGETGEEDANGVDFGDSQE